MCGIHAHDGTPIGHAHQTGVATARRAILPIRGGLPLPGRSRRAFLGDMGRGVMAMAVFTPAALAACSSDDQGDSTAAASSDTDPDRGAGADPVGEATSDPAESTDDQSATADDQVRWARANLGFVSAFVLARGNTAAIVDTGVPGSAETIGSTLQTLGLTYDDVNHVILTHRHGDHVGSTGEVLDLATGAAVYAGQADLDGIQVEGVDNDGIVPLVGDEDVFGFRMVATPGHTPGHMAVYDEATELLVAGDAIFTDGGAVVEGPERFFDDIPRSRDTIRSLAALSVNTLLVGHGDPIEQDADQAIAALAASLS